MSFQKFYPKISCEITNIDLIIWHTERMKLFDNASTLETLYTQLFWKWYSMIFLCLKIFDTPTYLIHSLVQKNNALDTWTVFQSNTKSSLKRFINVSRSSQKRLSKTLYAGFLFHCFQRVLQGFSRRLFRLYTTRLLWTS